MHKTIDKVLASLMSAKGLNQKALSDGCGVPQPTISRILKPSGPKGIKSPSDEQVFKLANYFGITTDQMRGRSPLPERYQVGAVTDSPSEDALDPGPPITSPFRAVKIVGTAQMGSEGYWSELDEGEGFVDVPSSDPDAYALRLRGDSMAPAIRSGWIAVIEPNRNLVPGEYVMIRLHDGESMLKELLYSNDHEISVMSINDAYGRRTIPVEQVQTIHYVGAIVPPSKMRL